MASQENKIIEEMQFIEQSLQTILMQKQAFQMELSETQNALDEIKTSKGQAFKIIGQIMITSDKEKLKSELENKQKILSLRLNSFEKQESSLTKQLDSLRQTLMSSSEKSKK